jgi:hypothetical protein
LIRAWPDYFLDAPDMAVEEQGKGHPGLRNDEARDALFFEGFRKISDKKIMGCHKITFR